MQMQKETRRDRLWAGIVIGIILIVIGVAIFASGCTVMPRAVEKPPCRVIDGVGACRVP